MINTLGITAHDHMNTSGASRVNLKYFSSVLYVFKIFHKWN